MIGPSGPANARRRLVCERLNKMSSKQINLDAPWHIIGHKIYSNSGRLLATLNIDDINIDDAAVIANYIRAAPDIMQQIGLAEAHLEIARARIHYPDGA